jgi:zinc protease
MRCLWAGTGLVALLGCATSENFSANTPPFIPEPTPKYFLPSFTASKMGNGMTLLVNQDRAIPMMSIAVAFSSGSVEDPDGKSGVASFMFEMLSYRSRKLPRMIMAGAFDDIAAFQTRVYPDGVILQGTALADRAEPAFLLLQEMLLNPSFEKGDVDFVREVQLNVVRSLETRVDVIAQRVLLQTIFGSEHPLGSFSQGSIDTVNTIESPDLVSTYDRIVRPERMTMIVSGPIQPEEIAKVVERIFGKWKPTTPAPAIQRNLEIPNPDNAPDRKLIHFVPRKGLAQSVVLVGRVAIPERHPDAPLWKLSTYRAAGYASGYLRELQGITYGVSGNADLLLKTGHLSIETQVDAPHTRQAVNTILEQIDAAGASWLSPDGLVVSGVSMVFRESNALLSLKGRTINVGRNLILGLPWDHIKKSNEFWIDPRQHTFRGLDVFSASRWQIVIVGDPEIVMPQIKDHGFDSVAVVKQ